MCGGMAIIRTDSPLLARHNAIRRTFTSHLERFGAYSPAERITFQPSLQAATFPHSGSFFPSIPTPVFSASQCPAVHQA